MHQDPHDRNHGTHRITKENGKSAKDRPGSRRRAATVLVLLTVLSCTAASVQLALNRAKRTAPTEGGTTEPAPVMEGAAAQDDIDARLRAALSLRGTAVGTPSDGRREGVFTILAVGTDASGYLTDTIAMATFDAGIPSVSILSIPRDTISLGTRGETRKINAAYAQGGIERLNDELEALLGYRADRWVTVDFSAFENLIDALGGLPFDVPQDMYKNTGDMVIDLKAGPQVLDGEHALMLMRYRGYPDADIGRIGMQQQVLRALAALLARPAALLHVPELASIVLQNVRTDLTLSELFWIAARFLSLDGEHVVMNTLPHRTAYIGGISYVLPGEGEILALVNDVYNPYEERIEELHLAPIPVQQAEPGPAATAGPAPRTAGGSEVPGWITGGRRDPAA